MQCQLAKLKRKKLKKITRHQLRLLWKLEIQILKAIQPSWSKSVLFKRFFLKSHSMISLSYIPFSDTTLWFSKFLNTNLAVSLQMGRDFFAGLRMEPWMAIKKVFMSSLMNFVRFRISERLSYKESAIFFLQILHTGQNHSTSQPTAIKD